MDTNKNIPGAITTAAVSILAPYVPDLTTSKLLAAICCPVEEPVEERLTSRQHAADRIGISLPTLDRMIRDNELTARKVRGRVLIRQSCIDSVITGAA